METENYTYEKFKEDFEDAQTPEAKQEALMTLLDSDIDVKEYKEDIQEYRAQLQDLKDQIDGVIDASINTGIENGTFELYTCTEDVDQYKAGNNYYVKVQTFLSKGLKDLIWIATDEGIGTLKRKNLVTDFDFSKHFTIFV